MWTPIVARLENAGILISRIEDIDPVQVGRPRRKYYCFTPDGAEKARHALAQAYTPQRAGHLRPGLAGGAA